MKIKCEGGCGRTATQEVVSLTESLRVCGYCAVTFVESGYKISAYK